MPDEGEDIMEHLAKKYGQAAVARFASPDSPLAKMGRAVGIAFTTKRNAYPTIKAHALMEHIKQSDNDKANGLMEEMYKCYFEKGENINNIETLAELAAKIGIMDKEEVYEACSNEDLLRLVRQKDTEYKTRKNISGVPFFIIHQNNGKPPLSLSGAQPPEILAQQLQKAAAIS